MLKWLLKINWKDLVIEVEEKIYWGLPDLQSYRACIPEPWALGKNSQYVHFSAPNWLKSESIKSPLRKIINY